MDNQTRTKVREYVKDITFDGGDWNAVADAICFALEKGTIITTRSITYDAKGEVVGIKGMEVREGILQFKEKKKPIKAVVEEDDTPNPILEQLRNTSSRRSKISI